MGNKLTHKSSFNIMDIGELKEFLSNLNVLDIFAMDTNLSISSKCLCVINNLINHVSLCSQHNDDDLSNYNTCHIFNDVSIPFDRESSGKIETLKTNCQLIRNLSIFSSSFNFVEEYIELDNFVNLMSLQLENVPINFVLHLKSHRDTLVKLAVHQGLKNLESLIESCGGDQSFKGEWSKLVHLDVRFNELKTIDKSVMLLSNLLILDVSRNNLQSLDFIEKLPSLLCLNASYNNISGLPNIANQGLRVLIIGYNYISSLQGIRNFKSLTTLNASYNMITTIDCLQQLNELDYLKDLILSGNPICSSDKYRLSVLNVVSNHVIVDFALDGKIFSKKDRMNLNKVPVIIIEPPSSSTFDYWSQVPVIKPNINVDITTVQAKSPDAAPGSHLRNKNQVAQITDEESDQIHDFPDNILSQNDNFVVKKAIPGPLVIKHKTMQWDNDTGSETMTAGMDSNMTLQSPSQPFYLGNKTSNLICLSNITRTSFVKVSLQIIDHKFMAVDESNVTVDNINLWTLLVMNRDTEYNCILRLSFYNETASQLDNNIVYLKNRSLEFSNISELEEFEDNIKYYLTGFQISRDNVSNLETSIIIVCNVCYLKFEFLSKTEFRPIVCSNCQATKFKFEIAVSNLKAVIPARTEKLGTPISHSPTKPKSYLKSETSALVIKAISNDSILSSNQHGPSAPSSYQSFCTALGYQTDSENIKSEPESFYESQDLINEDSMDQSISSDLVAGMKIENYESRYFMRDMKNKRPNIPVEDEAIVHLNKILSTRWLSHQPNSNVTIYMQEVREIDDRIKLLLLTKVLNDEENLLAVFNSFFFYKPVSSTACESMVVISSNRILFYNWSDKDSPSFGDCLKLIVEFPLKKIVQINDCLRHQWIDIIFKRKSQVSLFVGDVRATKNIMEAIIESASNRQLTLNVRIQEIKDYDHNQIDKEMAKAMNEDGDGARDLCEYYLIRSCSDIGSEIVINSEYAPKLLALHPRHLFFIKVKFRSKQQQFGIDLLSALSIHDLTDKIIIDSTNECRCRLITCKANVNSFMDIEFLSPVTRSTVLLRYFQLYKDLYQTNLIFEICSLQKDQA